MLEFGGVILFLLFIYVIISLLLPIFVSLINSRIKNIDRNIARLNFRIKNIDRNIAKLLEHFTGKVKSFDDNQSREIDDSRSISKEEADRLEGLRAVEEAETITEPQDKEINVEQPQTPKPVKDIEFPLPPDGKIY